MRILKESVPDIRPATIQRWNKVSDKEKAKLTTELIDEYNKPDLLNIRNAISTCFYQHGIDPRKNGFIELFDKFKFNLTKDHEKYINTLNDLYISDQVDLSKDYLTLESLYDRSIGEFIYTVRLFNIVNTPHKIRQFFKDAEEIDEIELFMDDNKQIIKPVGKEGDGVETLFGTVESWSGEHGENDIDNSSYTKSKKGKKLSQKELNEIKKKHSYKHVDEIPEDLHKEGQIVWVYALKFYTGNEASKYISSKNIIEGFVIYKNGEWVLYNPSIE